jgi:ornithine--oxo-acid transaminase
MTFDITRLLKERGDEGYALADRALNSQFVKVLRAIGFDRRYVRAEGPHLYDDAGRRYLDLLAGFGVHALGRNHPTVVATLKDVLDAGLPNLVQLDCGPLPGLLAERLLTLMPPSLDKVFFCNSGTEAVEAAIKFSRAATRRPAIVHCDHAFHGLTIGALSLNGDAIFRDGFGPLLADARQVPFDDLDALESALSRRDVACFVVEPIQGKGVNMPSGGYLRAAAELCRRHGTLFVADEIQCGMGRTGKFLACEHWGVQPDVVLLAKALSGGFVPVGAVVTRRDVFEKVFDRMDKAVVHGSTFAKNNLAMAAGLATLHVLEEEKLVDRAADTGERLLGAFRGFLDRHEFVHDVRGKGLLLGIEFGAPRSLKLKGAWALLEKANRGLFCQMVTIPLLTKHGILAQVAGHGSHVVKLMPPYALSNEDVEWIVGAFDDVIADCHRVPGAVWDLATTLAGHALRARAGAG